MKREVISGHEVMSNGATVWVNGPDGMCLGRFSSFGIDVHRNLADQISTGKECIACTHERPANDDWGRFVELMKVHHGVVVHDRHKPAFCVETVEDRAPGW